MGHKIKFGINKSEAIKLIFELQKLIKCRVKYKEKGICGNITETYFESIFNALGYDDTVFPIGGGEEEYENSDLWEGESLIKRVALCKEIIELMQETFNIKD